MRTRRLLVGVVVVVAAFFGSVVGSLAAGDSDQATPSLGGGAGGGDGRPRPRVVEPRPGMDNVHAIDWERAKVRGQRKVRVFFWSGVEPCYVLDHVQVEYLRRTVRITLFEGSDPAARDQSCIEIAEYKAVDVSLSERLRGRRVVDGYRG